LSEASLRCENLHWGFDGDVHHVVELEVDAHEVKLRTILSFVVHLPTWVSFARNNMYIQNDKNEA
jgi:hypothetical protein